MNKNLLFPSPHKGQVILLYGEKTHKFVGFSLGQFWAYSLLLTLGLFCQVNIVSAQMGKAISLNGASDYVNLGTSLNPTGTALTVEAWVKPTANNGLRYVVGNENLSAGTYFLRFHGLAGTFQFYVCGTTVEVPMANVPLNQWTHIAGTYNGTTSTLYLNGQIAASTAVTGSLSNTNATYIGECTHPNGPGRFWAGQIDEVRIWSVTRTNEQIQENMNRTLTGTETGLMGYYDMESIPTFGNGQTVTDLAAGNGVQNGTTVGGASSPAFASLNNWGNALHLDGVNDYVSLANPSTAWSTITTNLTLEAWIRTTSNSTEQIIVHKEDNVGGYAIFLNASGVPYFSVFNSTGWVNAIAASAVPVNQWTHIAGVYNNSQLFLYVNGVLAATANKTGSITNLTNNTRIGSDMNGLRLFSGSLDEIRIWNVARTQSQIQAGVYNSVATSSNGLLAYYPFDQGIANGSNSGVSSATDIKSGLTGTLVNLGLTGNTSNWIARSPVITSPTQANITGVTAILGANHSITVGDLEEKGIIFGTSANLTLSNARKIVSSGTSTGAYTVAANNLEGGTKYYYRGYGYTATAVGYSPVDSFTTSYSEFGNALSFDGVDDHFYIGSNNASTPPPAIFNTLTNALTLEVWLKPRDYSVQRFLNRQDQNGYCWALEISNGNLSFYVNSTTSGSKVVAVSQNYLPLNQWTHVAGVYNGTQMILYVNGVSVGTIAQSGTIFTNSLYVGVGSAGNVGGVYKGEMDELRIWNVARTQAQIQANMGGSIATNTTGLIAYIPFNQGVPNAANPTISVPSEMVSNHYLALGGTFALSGNISNWVTRTANFANNTVTNNALALDGTDDYVVIPGANVNNQFANNQITLEGWFFPKTSSTGLPMLVGNEYTGSTVLAFAVYQVGSNLQAGMYNGGWIQTPLVAIVLNQWQHFACTYDQQNIKLYINGALRATFASTIPLPINANNWLVGKRWDIAEHFNGNLDEIRIWNVARTQTEIQANMYATFPAGSSGLIAYYPCNQGVAGGTNTGLTTLTDASGSNISGTLTNFALASTTSNWIASSTPMYDNSPIISNIQAAQATFTSTSAYVQTGSILEQGFIYNTGNTPPTLGTSTRIITNSTSLGAFSATPTGLLENQLYSVRGYITTASGTILSNSIAAFNTSLCRIAATDIAIISSSTTASATWTANATGATAYSWKVVNSGAGVNGAAVSSGTSNTPSASITNLLPGNDYEFYVLITGGCSTSTWSNVRTFSTKAEWNNALNFDGINDYVSLANGTAWNAMTNALTVELWVRPNNNTGSQILFVREGAGTGLVFDLTNGIPNFGVHTGSWSAASGTTTIPVNQWSHLAGVYNGAQIMLYVNGVLVAVTPKTGSLTAMNTTARLGIDLANARPFSGSIDEIRFWSTVRTASQIQAGMYTSVPTNSTDLVAYYPFDQGVANGTNSTFAATDIKSGLNGTLTNFTLAGNTSNWIARTPLVSTPTVANISGNTATIGATYSQSGTASLLERGFIWGTTSNITFSNGTRVAVAGNATGAYTATLSSLAFNTKYYYRGYAYSNDGLRYTLLDSFVTSCPAINAQDVANTVTPTSTSLTWAANGGTSFEWRIFPAGATPTGTPLQSGTVNTNGVTINNLSPLTSYDVYVRWACANSAWSGAITVITQNTWASALNFDGGNDYVNLGNVAAINSLSSAMAVEAWVRPTSYGSGLSYVIGNEGTAGGWYLRLHNSASLVTFGVTTNAGAVYYLASAPISLVPLNQWTHLAGVLENGVIKLYVNGALASSTAILGTLANPNGDTYIGECSHPSGANRFFNGSIDEIRIWNIARNATQIQAGMTSLIPANTSGLVAYYNFDAALNAANAVMNVSPGGSNVLANAVLNLVNNGGGSLVNFAKTGASSNFVAHAPVITTTAATGIGANAATMGGNLSSAGTGTSLEKGIIYSVSNTIPLLNGAGVIQLVSSNPAVGTFTSSVNSLSIGTKYYYRAYALANDGITYGSVLSFTTTCTTPTGLALSSITANSATLSWNAIAGVSGYNYKVVFAGAGVNGAAVLSGTTSNLNISLTGLTPGAAYDCYIQSNCAVGVTSNWSNQISFSTICDIASLPFSENFTTAPTASLPYCWVSQDENGDGVNWIKDAANRMTMIGNAGEDMNDWLFSKGINLVGGTSYLLSFSYGTLGAGDTEKLEVKYGNTANSANLFANAIYTNTNITNTTANNISVSFTPASSGNYYLAWHGISKFGTAGLFIDNVNLIVNACAVAPSIPSIAVSNLTATSATFSWAAVSGVSNYTWKVVLAGSGANAPSVAGGTTNTNSVNFSGLSGAVSYDFYVKSDCGYGITSEWVSTINSFTALSQPTLGATTATSVGGNDAYIDLNWTLPVSPCLLNGGGQAYAQGIHCQLVDNNVSPAKVLYENSYTDLSDYLGPQQPVFSNQVEGTNTSGYYTIQNTSGNWQAASGAWTAEAWVNNKSNSLNSSTLLEAVSGATTIFSIGFNPYQKVWVSGSGVTKTFATTIPANRWVHVAVTYYNGAATLFVDGQLKESQVISNLVLMGTYNAVKNYNGSVAELRFWNRKRTDIEIADGRFQTSFIGVGQTNLLLHWKWTSNSVNPTDLAQTYDGLNNTATFTGTALTPSAYLATPQYSPILGTYRHLVGPSKTNNYTLNVYQVGTGSPTSACATFTATGSTMAFQVPQLMTASDNGLEKIQLSWKNRSKLGDNFRIYRNGKLRDIIPGTTQIDSIVTYTDTYNADDSLSIENGVLYRYSVETFNTTFQQAYTSVQDSGRTFDMNLQATHSINLRNALQLEGTNDYLNFGNLSGITNAFTLEGWFKPATLPTGTNAAALITKENATTGDWGLSLVGSNLNCYAYNSSNLLANINVPYANLLLLNQWAHIAATYDGTTLSLYVNGRRVGKAALTGNLRNTVGVNISAGAKSGQGAYFAGLIDEIRIWNISRSITEIQEGMVADFADKTGLLSYLQFEEGKPSGNNTAFTTAKNSVVGGQNPLLLNFTLNGNSSNYLKANTILLNANGANIVANNSVNKVDLTWANLASYGNYINVKRNGVILATLPPATTFYSDASPIYGQNATYSIELIGADGFGYITDKDKGNVNSRGAIAGKALTYNGGYGLANVKITLQSQSDPSIKDSVLTDYKGEFAFNDLYYENKAKFNLTASIAGNHHFFENPKQITLADSMPQQLNVIFEDSVDIQVDATPLTLNNFQAIAKNNFDKVDIDWSYFNPSTDTAFFQIYRNAVLMNTNDNLQGGACIAGLGNILNLNGINDYAKIPAGVYVKGDFTIEAWVYPKSLTALGTILSLQNTASNDQVQLMYNGSSNKPQLIISNGITTTTLDAATALNLNEWAHIAVTLQGATATMYINGILSATNTAMSVPSATVRNECFIGKSQANYANANFDEIRIWESVRTPSQISAARNVELVGNESGLVLYYNMSKSENDILYSGLARAAAATSNAITVGSATTPTFVADKMGNSLALNGTNACAQGAEVTSLADAFTLEAYLYPQAQVPFGRIIELSNGTAFGSIALTYADATTLKPSLLINGNVVLTSSAALSSTDWSHIALVCANNRASLYLNGNLVASASLTPPADMVRNIVYLGKSYQTSVGLSNMKLDEVRIWNLARTQADIINNSTLALSGNEQGLVAYYDMEGVSNGQNNYIPNRAAAFNLGNATLFGMSHIIAANAYADETGFPGTSYTYKMTGYALQNGMVKTVEKTATLTYPPVANPLNFVAAHNPNLGTVNLRWEHASKNIDGFRLYKGSKLIAELPAYARTYQDIFPQPASSSTYTLKAKRKIGLITSESGGATVTLNVPALTAVSTVTATVNTSRNSVTVSWAIPTIYTANNFNYEGFNIYRKTGSGATILIAQVFKGLGTTYEDKDGAAGSSSNIYSVRTFRRNGNRGIFESSAVASSAVTYPIVSLPTALTATNNTLVGEVLLSWTPAYASGARNIDGQIVYSNNDSIATLSATANTYRVFTNNTALIPYRVRTFRYVNGVRYLSANTVSASGKPANASVNPQLVTNFKASTDLPSHIRLSWDYPDYITSTYKVYRDGVLVGILDAAQRTYYDSTAKFGKTYLYQIEAINGANTSQRVACFGKLKSLLQVSGQALTQNGEYGMPNVDIVLTTTNGFYARTRTDSTGFYRITELPHNQALVVTMTAEGANCQFVSSTQTFSIGSEKNYLINFLNRNNLSPTYDTLPAKIMEVRAIADYAARRVAVSWKASNMVYDGFEVYRANSIIADVLNGENPLVYDTEGYPGILYAYSVRAYSWRDGKKIYSDYGAAIQTFPYIEAPINLTAVLVPEKNKVVLKWSHIWDNHAYYKVERNGQLLGIIKRGKALIWEDVTGSPGQQYTYSVTAIDEVGEKTYGSLAAIISIIYPNVGEITSIGLSTPLNTDNTYTLDFDGTDDYVNLGTVASINNLKNAMTVEAWVNPRSVAPYTLNYIAGNEANGGWFLRFNNYAGMIQFGINTIVNAPTTLLTLNQWNHLAGVFQGDSLKLYLNGNLVAAEATTDTITNPNGATYIGECTHPQGAGRFFNGKMKELRIWNVARTQAEIQNNMNLVPASGTSLLARYDFNQGAGTVLQDKTNNAINGTLVNFALAGNSSNWIGNTVCPSMPVPTQNHVLVSWSADTTNMNGFRIYRGGNFLKEVPQTQFSYADYEGVPDLNQTYEVKALVNRNGNSFVSEGKSGSIVFPSLTYPTTVSLKDTVGLVRVRWKYSLSGVDGFYVFRDNNATAVTPLDTIMVDTTLNGFYAYDDNRGLAGTNYYYKVQAYSVRNGVKYLSEINTCASPIIYPKPVAPYNLTASTTNQTFVELTWQYSPTAEANGFRIFRNNVNIADITSEKRTYYDILPPLPTCSYYVKAFKIVNGVTLYSDASNTATGTITANLGNIAFSGTGNKYGYHLAAEGDALMVHGPFASGTGRIQSYNFDNLSKSWLVGGQDVSWNAKAISYSNNRILMAINDYRYDTYTAPSTFTYGSAGAVGLGNAADIAAVNGTNMFVGNSNMSQDVNYLGQGLMIGQNYGGASIANQSPVSFNGDLTVEFWIKPDAVQNAIFSHCHITYDYCSTTTTQNAMAWSLEKSSRKLYLFRTGAYLTSNAQIPSNVWTHVAYSRVGTQGRLYINGALDQTVTDTYSSPPNNNLGLSIGQTLAGSACSSTINQKFDGVIDEFRLWNVGKTQAEIQANMKQRLKGNEANLQVYLDMEGNVSNKATATTVSTSGAGPYVQANVYAPLGRVVKVTSGTNYSAAITGVTGPLYPTSDINANYLVLGQKVDLSTYPTGNYFMAYPTSIATMPPLSNNSRIEIPYPNGTVGTDMMSYAVGISNSDNKIIAGAPGKNGKGAVYIYEKTSSSAPLWEQKGMINSPDGTGSDLFGASVDIEGDFLLVGSPGHQGGKGAAYLYAKAGSAWQFVKKISGSAVLDSAGKSVKLTTNFAFVGIPGTNNNTGMVKWEDLRTGILGNVAASQGDYTTKVRVQWDYLVNPSAAISGFRIFRDGVPLQTVGDGDRFFYDDNIVKGKHYLYEVCSYNSTGESIRQASEGWSQSDGVIEGQAISLIGGTGIQGVSIKATALIDGVPYSYNTITDQSGNYSFSGIYYGQNGATYTLTADYKDHLFLVNPISATLGGLTVSRTGQNFIDKTAYIMQGHIARKEVGCGLDSIKVWANYHFGDGSISRSAPVYTDIDGNYSLTFSPYQLDLVKITVQVDSVRQISTSAGSKYFYYHFKPLADTTFTDIEGIAKQNTINFEDTTRYQVDIQVRTACNENLNGGKFKIHIRSEEGCFDKIFTTNTNGYLSAELPPLNLLMNVEGVENLNAQTDLVVNYLRYRPSYLNLFDLETDSLKVVSQGKWDSLTQVGFIYHKAPSISVLSGFERYLCDDPSKAAIVTQAGEYRVELRVTEFHNNANCEVQSGYIVIENAGATQQKDTLLFNNLTGGFELYNFTAGNPNLVSPYSHLINFKYYSTEGEMLGERNMAMIVEGGAQLPGSDIIVDLGENGEVPIPLFVLRDPPGDGSSATLEEGSTTTKTISISQEGNASLYLGTEGQVVAATVGGMWSADFNIGAGGGGSRTWEITTTTTKSISTYDDSAPVHIGEEGDVMVGMGLALQYGLMEKLAVIDCETISKTTVLGFSPHSIKTQWMYTLGQIKLLINEYDFKIAEIQAGRLSLQKSDGTYYTQAEAAGKLLRLKSNWEKMKQYHDRETLPYYALCDKTNKMKAPEPFHSYALAWRLAFCPSVGTYDVNDQFIPKDNIVWDQELVDKYNTIMTAVRSLESGSLSLQEAMVWQYGPDAFSNTQNYVDEQFNLLHGIQAENVTFGSGINYSKTYESANASASAGSANFATDLIAIGGIVLGETQVSLIAGTPVAGTVTEMAASDIIPIKFGVGFNYTISEEWETAKEKSNVISYTLADDDDADQFSVTVIQGPATNFGPYFSLLGGRSSCPQEEATIVRDRPSLYLFDEATQSATTRQAQENVEDYATFYLQIANNSLFNEGRDFKLVLEPFSNPNGAMVTCMGQKLNEAPLVLVGMQPNSPMVVPINVQRGLNGYQYDSLTVKIIPYCGNTAEETDEANLIYEDLNTTVKMSVSFKSPCSDITIITPDNSWVIHNKSMNENQRENVPIRFMDYNPNNENLKTVRLEYRRLGAGTPWKPIPNATWTRQVLATYNIQNFNPSQVPYFFFDWDITDNYQDYTDGEYEIRAVAECELAGHNYSQIIKGTIARSGQLYGYPQPSDHVWTKGDEISVSFNRDLECTSLVDSNFVIRSKTHANTFLPGMISCYNNKLLFTPSIPLKYFDGDTLEMIIGGVRTDKGNLMDTVRWEFRVIGSDLYVKGNKIELNLTQGETAQAQVLCVNNAETSAVSYELTNLNTYSHWLSCENPTALIAENEKADIRFQLDSKQMLLGETHVYLDLLANGVLMDSAVEFLINVFPAPPSWHVNPANFSESMTLLSNYNFDESGIKSQDTMDLISAWIDNEIRGVANISRFSSTNYAALMQIYGNASDAGKALTFRVWNASQGAEYDAHPDGNINILYATNSLQGSVSAPKLLDISTTNDLARYLPLNKGWNFFSFSTANGNDALGNSLASLRHVSNNDLIKTATKSASYVSGIGWVSANGLDSTNVHRGYQLFLQNADTLRFTGSAATIKPIALAAGWNLIGMPSLSNVPIDSLRTLVPQSSMTIKTVARAPANYSPNMVATYATNQWTYAPASKMKFLYPNFAYQLRVATATQLRFPNCNTTAAPVALRIGEATPYDGYDHSTWEANAPDYEHNMLITATLGYNKNQIEQEGSMVAAYRGAECRGLGKLTFVPELNKAVVSMFVYTNEDNETLDFRIYDAKNDRYFDNYEPITFHKDSIIGRFQEPYHFSNLAPDNSFEGSVYPNPFSHKFTLNLKSDKVQTYQVQLLDIAGHLIQAVALDTESMEVAHTIRTETLDLPSGVYILQVKGSLGETRSFKLVHNKE